VKPAKPALRSTIVKYGLMDNPYKARLELEGRSPSKKPPPSPSTEREPEGEVKKVL